MASDFRRDIQGMRALAVAAVVLYHAGLPFVGGGYAGVDVFFVISGYLITAHLLGGLRATGRLDLGAFYARRARRLLPASFAVLLATAVAAYVIVTPLRLVPILRDAIAAAFYVPNYRFAWLQTDYLAGTEPSPFQHFWSLGVEEQFYLFWPLILLGLWFLARRRPSPGRWVAGGIAVLALASVIGCLVLERTAQPLAFFSLPTRAWELAVGGLVACTAGAAARLGRLASATLAWVGLAALLVPLFAYTAAVPYPGPPTLVPVLGAAAVIAFCPAAGTLGPAPVLGWRPLQPLGELSYSLYLVHWPLFVLYTEAAGPGGASGPLVSTALVVAAVGLAWLLHRFVEAPLRLRGAVAKPVRRRSLAAALAASVTLCLVLVGGQAAVALKPMDAGRDAAPSAVTRLPQGTGFVPANLSPGLTQGVDDTGELYTDGCQQGLSGAQLLRCDFGDPDAPFTVALFGDSHAGRWFVPLQQVAQQAGVHLRTYTKSGCRSLDTVAEWTTKGGPSCAAWRASALAALRADPPQLIVLSNHLTPDADSSAARTEADWRAGIEAVLAQLPAASKVVILSETPEFGYSMPECLSGHVADARACSAPRATVFDPGITAAEHDVAAAGDASLIDLDDWFCNAHDCPGIIGATLVYSDEHHVTATYAAELAEPLGRALAPFLP